MESLFHFYLLEGTGFIQRFIEWIIKYGGLYILLLVVFAETGLFVGFLFPGDSLLFAAGIYVDDLANEFFGVHWSVIMMMVMVASILGNMVGYWFGRKAGPLLYERKETWLFKRKHLVRATDFYHRYGKATIFLAKFLPIIRTFAPIVAGVVKMERPAFMFYNIIGSVCWVASMMMGGYFLEAWVQRRWDFSLKDHIEAITIGIIVITTLPVLYKLFFAKKPIIPPPTDTNANS
ncbi:MAG TPA: VTT domain-containing protein [Chitinophagaceae bacterium]